ncbi:cytochrome c oxidase subunit II [Halocynthiibacter namhaensis]|uniref:cytochrome c oxidase subunit II n=1 Tax=Halocynthiibacter namhaensis TaxID=1290553 RepID=UPI000578E71C|nr:cytochrome c oxidase subunit II [Halocynthiibacter namhaensis]
MQLKSTVSGFLASAASVISVGSAFAQDSGDGITGLEVIGAPTAGGVNFQPAATNIAQQAFGLDTLVLWIISGVVLFVVALLAYVILRFNQRVNKTPATFTHHSQLEIAWTILPVVVLVFIGAFSLPVLFNQQEIPEGDIHIKATGNQWYWSYEYIGTDIAFDSFMLGRSALEENGYTQDEYLLATDTAIVLPSGKDIVVRVTAADVIHSWAIPAFGVKQDGVPGRTAELWFNVDVGNEGIYFGQCSELCGKDHAYMPITVKIVTQAEYEAWLGRQASLDVDATIQVASAD